MRLRMMAVGVTVIMLQVSVALRDSEAGHRQLRRHVNTSPGIPSVFVNSNNGSIRSRKLNRLSGYRFSSSRPVPVQRWHRHVPVNSFSYVSVPYRYSRYRHIPSGFSSYGYSTGYYRRPSVGISVHRPGFSFRIGRSGYGTGISLGIFGR